MAAQPSLSTVQEYLRTTSDPDCEYVAGMIEERAVGEYDHATRQSILNGYFLMREKSGEFYREPNCAFRLLPIAFACPT